MIEDDVVDVEADDVAVEEGGEGDAGEDMVDEQPQPAFMQRLKAGAAAAAAKPKAGAKAKAVAKGRKK